MNRYKIYAEYNFGIVTLQPGNKTFEELFQLLKDFRENNEFPLVKYVLVEMRGCNFQFEISKIDEITSLMKKYKHVDNQQIVVYMVDNPIETAYVQLLFNSMTDKREFCSTVERAYDILKLPVTFSEFLSMIDI